MSNHEDFEHGKPLWVRIILASGVAAAWAIGCYWLVMWVRPEGVVSASFALVQPAAICAFIGWVADPHRVRSLRFHMAIPWLSAVGMIVVSIFVLREGAVCILMLSPLWILSGTVGSYLVWKLRPRRLDHPAAADTFAAYGILVLPVIAFVLEPMMPVPVDRRSVVSEVIIDAPADAIWPLMKGMGRVPHDAGSWNVTQDIVGVPRPHSARLEGSGIGARRHARWDRGVVFDELVTEWQPGRAIGWQFDFAASAGWEITDPHLHPDGHYMRIESGGYTLVPLADGRHRLSLHTTYSAQTHFNAYAALWGRLFLGDIQHNVLAVIRQRAETD